MEAGTFTLLSEDQRIAEWKVECFEKLGFSTDVIALLISWKTDPHDAEKLIAGGCEIDLALDILRP